MTIAEKDTLADLIERLEKATGPDRELDGEIFAAVETHPYGDVIAGKGGRTVYAGSAPHAPGQGQFEVAPRYTASLDAALALVEERLPGREWSLDTLRGCASAGFQARDGELDYVDREHATISDCAIAILLALLRALQQGDQS